MRITYRCASNKEYWAKRWDDIPVDEPMENMEAYPLKYSIRIVKNKTGRILEASCGAGRILRYYHNRGHDIVGLEFIGSAVRKLKAADPTLQVKEGDISSLNFADQEFRYVLAFGLYHNLEHGLEDAIGETYRVLESGGLVCASFRADNIQTRLSDYLADRQSQEKNRR